MTRPFTVADSKYADELIKLGFSDRLITTPEDCKRYVEHCNKYNMKFLKGSYGTLVHKQFTNYFKISTSNKMRRKLQCINENTGRTNTSIHFDHTNLFKSTLWKDVYVLTSSPYNSLSISVMDTLQDYPYDVYVINPNFLDYHTFIGRSDCEMRHPLWDVNYLFTNAFESQIADIEKTICETINGRVFPVFVKIHSGDNDGNQ